MKIKCKCGEVIDVVDDGGGDEVQSDLRSLFGLCRLADRRLAELEKQAREVTPYEDLVERHRRLVEYVLKHIGDVALIDEDVVVETRAKLNVGG